MASSRWLSAFGLLVALYILKIYFSYDIQDLTPVENKPVKQYDLHDLDNAVDRYDQPVHDVSRHDQSANDVSVHDQPIKDVSQHDQSVDDVTRHDPPIDDVSGHDQSGNDILDYVQSEDADHIDNEEHEHTELISDPHRDPSPKTTTETPTVHPPVVNQQNENVSDLHRVDYEQQNKDDDISENAYASNLTGQLNETISVQVKLEHELLDPDIVNDTGTGTYASGRYDDSKENADPLLVLMSGGLKDDAHDEGVMESRLPDTLTATTAVSGNNDLEDNKGRYANYLYGGSSDVGWPGFNGTMVHINKTSLTASQLASYKTGMKTFAYNQFANSLMSVHRSLPDFRHPKCRSEAYPSSLPNTSVIITFYNEALSALLRTVHSVLNRSPPDLLAEVVLVDDFSDMEDLKEPLETYVADHFSKVRIVRAERREGLIRARLLGAATARGTVLTFLDSHCECTLGWLEPLLTRVAADKSIVAAPVIDNIHFSTMKYLPLDLQTGGFSWKLFFVWDKIEDQNVTRDSEISPLRTPTIAGGLFSVNREYFLHIGAYDPGMNVWGGENLELSFRVWMCGGQLEIVPCSRVGHIYRFKFPYNVTGSDGRQVTLHNCRRLAEVWMDNYKDFYYSYYKKFNKSDIAYGDVTDRLKLKQQLSCKTFAWYLKHVYPLIYMPTSSFRYGKLGNYGSHMCLDVDTEVFIDCQSHLITKKWNFTSASELRCPLNKCLDYMMGKEPVFLECHGDLGTQEWQYLDTGKIYHPESQHCLSVNQNSQPMRMTMEVCQDSLWQKWEWLDQ